MVALAFGQPPLPARATGRQVEARTWLIKRVAALPGDPVPRDGVPALRSVTEERVPPGQVVLLGDNRRCSVDSRQLGYFPLECILGVVRESAVVQELRGGRI